MRPLFLVINYLLSTLAFSETNINNKLTEIPCLNKMKRTTTQCSNYGTRVIKRDSLPTKSQMKTLQDHFQYDIRTYRSAMYCFYHGLYKYYGKVHKDILGELEQVHKIQLTKEELLSIDNNLSQIIVQKNLEKLSRDPLARNSSTAKRIQAYYESYWKDSRHVEGSQQQQEKTISKEKAERSLENPQRQKIKDDISHNFIKSGAKKRSVVSELWMSKNETAFLASKLNKKQNIKQQEQNQEEEKNKKSQYLFYLNDIRRNFKSKNNFTAASSNNDNYLKKQRLIRASNRKQKTHESQIKNKSFNNDLSFDKNFHHNLNIHHSHSQEKQMDNYEKRHIDKISSTQFYENQNIFEQRIPSSNSFQIYRPQTSEGVSKKNNKLYYFNFYQKNKYIENRKNKEELTKEKIKSKLFLIGNNALSTNMAPSQGYKPKTKCWMNEKDPKKVSGGNSKVGNVSFFNK